MNKALMASFVIVIALSATIIMAAGENKQISLQGKLMDASGKPLDGTYAVKFDLYATDTGGTSLWNEVQSVTVSKGLFQTQLGSVTPFPATVTFDVPYWVEITVNGEKLSPRYVLAGSPYTVRAPVIPTVPTSFDASAIVSGVLSTSRLPLIGTALLQDQAVTSGKLASSAVVAGKVAANAIQGGSGGNIVPGSIDSSNINNNVFTTYVASFPSNVYSIDINPATGANGGMCFANPIYGQYDHIVWADGVCNCVYFSNKITVKCEKFDGSMPGKNDMKVQVLLIYK
jgi:hypothetical protein